MGLPANILMAAPPDSATDCHVLVEKSFPSTIPLLGRLYDISLRPDANPHNYIVLPEKWVTTLTSETMRGTGAWLGLSAWKFS